MGRKVSILLILFLLGSLSGGGQWHNVAVKADSLSNIEPIKQVEGSTPYLTSENLAQWKYYRPVIVKEKSGQTLEDFQVLINLTSANFDFSQAQPDGSDIRIVDEYGDFLPYWIEEWNATAKKALIWTVVPEIPANGEVRLKIYYGNPNAVSRSDGDKVFEFFDDFNGNSLNTSKWTVSINNNGGTYEVAGGKLKLIRTKLDYNTWLKVISKTQFKMPVIFEAKLMDTSNHGDAGLAMGCYNGSPRVVFRHYYDQLELDYVHDVRTAYTSYIPAKWYHISMWAVGTTDYANVDGVQLKYDKGTELSSCSIMFRVDGYDEYTGYVDWILVRKYAPKDPETIVGAQEIANPGYLNVTSTPTRAKVYIDGGYAGRTPLPEYPLSPGYHVVGVAYPGLPTCSTLVTITDNKTSAVSPNLTALSREGGLKWVWSSKTPVKTAATTPDGNLTVLGDGDYLIAVNHDGIPLWYHELPSTISQVAVSSDGSLIAAGTLYDNFVYVLDGKGNLLWKKEVTGNVQALAVSNDGNYIAVGTSGSLLHLFKRDGTQLWVYPPNSGTQSNKNVITVAISPNDEYVAAGRLDGTLWLIKIDGTPVFSRYLGGAVNDVAISEDGKYLLAGSNDNHLYVYTTSGELKWSKAFSNDVYRVRTAAGNIAVGTWDGKVDLLDFNKNTLWENSIGSPVTALDMSANGSYVVAGSAFGKVSVFRTVDGTAIWSYSTGSRVWQAEIVPETGEVVVASKDLRYFNALSFVECKLEAENAINSAETLIKNATEHGIDVTKALDLLNRAKEELSAGDCKTAKDLADQATVEANNAIEEMKTEAEGTIESAENEITTAENRGINVTDAVLLLNQAKSLFSEGYYPAAKNKALDAYQLAQNLILKTDAEEAISLAQNTINNATEHGINVTDAKNTLNQAEKAYNNGEYEKAKELATTTIQKTRDEVDAAKEEALSKINLAENETRNAENLGVNVSEAKHLLNDALDLFNQGYYPEAGEKADAAYQKAQEAILKNEALKAIKLAEDAVSNVSSQGINVDEARNIITQANETLTEGNYTGAKELALKARANAFLSLARAMLQEATEKGYEVSDEIALLHKATGEYNSGDYEEATADAQEVVKGIRSKIEQAKQKAREEIDRANKTMERIKQELELAKGQNVNQSILSNWENALQGAANTLDSAVRAYQEEDYINAQNLASSSYKSLSSILDDMDKTLVGVHKKLAEEYIQMAREALQNATSARDALKTVDIDTQSLQLAIMNANSTLQESVSAFDSGDYDTAISKAEESIKTINDAMSLANQKVQEKAGSEISAAGECIVSAENRGIKVDDAEAHLESARSAFSRGEYITAIEEAVSAKSICNQTTQLFDSVSTMSDQMADALSTLRSEGIGCPDAKSLLESSKEKIKSGDYLGARNTLNEALNRIASCQKRGEELLQNVQSVNSTLVSLREKGYYTGDAGTLLKKALDAIKLGNFDDAGNYITQANSTLIQLKEKGESTLEKINEAEKAIEDAEKQGLNPSSAKKLLQEAKEAMARGDYSRAVDLAGKAIDKANDVDGDGIPNSQDPFPTVNNYIVYGVIGTLLLVFMILLAKYLKRRKLNKLYREIVAAFEVLQRSVVPAEASQNMEELKGLIKEANQAHRESNMKKLERILGKAKSLQREVESKMKEYESLKKEIIAEINSILGVPQETEETGEEEEEETEKEEEKGSS